MGVPQSLDRADASWPGVSDGILDMRNFDNLAKTIMPPRIVFRLVANKRRKVVLSFDRLLAGIMAQQIFTRLLKSLTRFGVTS